MNAESEMAGADGLGGEPTPGSARDVINRIRANEKRRPMQDQMGEAGGNPANLDPCAQIAESVGYSDGADGDEGGVDALIDYKNALEDALRRALDENRTADSEAARAAERIAAQVPRLDEWRSAADFMQHAAETLDIYGVSRPDRYAE